MKTYQKAIYFIVLPIIGILMYPPTMLFGSISSTIIVALAILSLVLLGVSLLRGRRMALTFSIFLQGLNVIIRMMMVFPFALRKDGSVDIIYIVTTLLGLCISFYLMLALDGRKIQTMMST
jgi:hypothetical protein